jgi:CheY-like chemotaxis protein
LGLFFWPAKVSGKLEELSATLQFDCTQSRADATVNRDQRRNSALKQAGRSITILMADDDEDDWLLVKDAFCENHLLNDLRFVADGQELMDYLHHRNSYSDPSAAPCPGLILLDLNMPRKDGREALREIKADPRLRRIPVVVLTTSEAEKDILRSYDLGASSFISKPVTFQGLVQVVKSFGRYWLEIVELPTERDAC